MVCTYGWAEYFFLPVGVGVVAGIAAVLEFLKSFVAPGSLQTVIEITAVLIEGCGVGIDFLGKVGRRGESVVECIVNIHLA